MTWREKMVALILLLVARMLADDPAVAADIKNVSNKISVESGNTPSSGVTRLAPVDG